MSREEQIYLIQCILEDVRGNWAFQVEERVEFAKDLCEELGDKDFITLAGECAEFLSMEDKDGRFFRADFPYGYQDMDKLHNLPHTLADKSDEFKGLADVYITYPEYRFDDVEEEKYL